MPSTRTSSVYRSSRPGRRPTSCSAPSGCTATRSSPSATAARSAFFQFANKSDQDLFDPELTPSPFRHIALKVDPALQQEIHDRLTQSGWKPDGTYVLEHGYCRSLYTEDPNGLLLEFTADVDNADDIAADRRGDAHDTLKRWLDGDHTSNNTYR